jgi:hypothetical protein
MQKPRKMTKLVKTVPMPEPYVKTEFLNTNKHPALTF